MRGDGMRLLPDFCKFAEDRWRRDCSGHPCDGPAACRQLSLWNDLPTFWSDQSHIKGLHLSFCGQ